MSKLNRNNTKRCTHCKEYKDKSEFYKQGFKYLKSECKLCSKIYAIDNKIIRPTKEERRDDINTQFKNYWEMVS